MVTVAAVLLTVVAITQQAIGVSLDGHPYRIAKGSTLGELLTIAHQHARPGSLMDVEGIVIRAAATPGRVLVDGRPRRSATILHAGDRIRVLDGDDSEEGTVKIVRRVGHQLTDPQFRLEQLPGIETITVGKYSRKVAGVRFEAAGHSVKPERSVALTFDDGPSPYTGEFLKLLRDQKVKATFFLVGVQVQKYPDVVRKEVKAGMTLGNHSWSHPTRPPFARLPATRAADEVDRAQTIIKAAGGKAKLFRPPGGSFSPETTAMVRKHELRTVMWSVDPKDWRRGRSAGAIASAVLSKVRPGSIVVMHDGGPNVANTLAALPAIIRGIRARGLHLVAL
jgi:peptidoglycan/xylan/chitin deacetylase (PgdA/CDA1 family)